MRLKFSLTQLRNLLASGMVTSPTDDVGCAMK